MERKLFGAALLLGLAVLPAFAADEKKDDKKPAEKLVHAGTASGKILSIDETKHSIKLQVTFSIPKLNDGAYRALMQAQIDLKNALAKKDVNGARNAQNAIATNTRNLYTYDKKTKDYDLNTIEDVVVRLAQPPAAFDDKGTPKKFTKKELDELRGPDKKLPGYTGEFSNLRSGQMITVSLMKPKPDPKAPKPRTKDEMEEAALANKPQVSMILIVAEPKD